MFGGNLLPWTTRRANQSILKEINPGLFTCSGVPVPNRSAVIQSLSCVLLFVIPWTTACQASLSFIISQSLLKLMLIESGMPSNHLALCRPLLLWPSIFNLKWMFPKSQ